MQNEKNDPEQIKPDLKHDTMEYSAATDGDDFVDADKDDDDAISAEELDVLEEDNFDEQAAALNSMENDRQADDDVNFDEKDIEETDEP